MLRLLNEVRPARARTVRALEAIRNKTYPLRTVIDALSTYSLGYSCSPTMLEHRLV